MATKSMPTPQTHIQMLPNGDVARTTVHTSTTQSVIWKAPPNQGDWLVIFQNESPFTEGYYHVPQSGMKNPAMLRSDVVLNKTYKYTTANSSLGIVVDPEIEVRR